MRADDPTWKELEGPALVRTDPVHESILGSLNASHLKDIGRALRAEVKLRDWRVRFRVTMILYSSHARIQITWGREARVGGVIVPGGTELDFIVPPTYGPRGALWELEHRACLVQGVRPA